LPPGFRPAKKRGRWGPASVDPRLIRPNEQSVPQAQPTLDPLVKGIAGVASLGISALNLSCPYVNIMIGGSNFPALIDSGAAVSLISSDFYRILAESGAIRRSEKVTVTCLTASNAPMDIELRVSFKFKIQGFSWMWDFLVSKDMKLSCILGANFIRDTGLIIDLQRKCCYFKFNRSVLVPLLRCSRPVSVDEVDIAEDSEAKPKPDHLAHLQPDQRKLIEGLCARFPEVLTPKLGLTTLMEYEIRLTDNEPVRSHPYKLAPPKMEALRKIIDELLKQGVIEPSRSQYSSAAFLVPKPNGKYRMVLDYRKLNAKIEIDSVPLPDLHSAFDWFGKARFFTVFDLNQAYHQIPLKEESRHLTSFCVPWNLYQFRRVPMGIAVGAQTLTRLLDSIFHDVKFKFVFNYLDDLLVYSETFEEHVNHLEVVLERLKEAGLTVNPEKVDFAQPEISFLGHLVSSRGISVDPSKTQGIRDFPPPRDAKGIARFIGMINFYRRFIPNVAEIAAPLNALRKKGAKFEWGEAHQSAFDRLKEAIMQPPVLRMPDFSRPFILQTDASSSAIAAVISQTFDGVRQPIAFASRTLTQAEKKSSSVYELECLAVVFGVDKFRRFLEHSEFLLETDNQALSWLLAHPRQLGKIGRWVVKIAAFKFKVQHVRGSQNLIADALSRMYHETPSPAENPHCGAVLLDFPLAFENITTYQRQDEELGPIIRGIEDGTEFPPYSLSKGVLCCRQRVGGGTRIVVPSALVPMVFEYFHSSPVGAHLGIHKTIARIRKEFIWRGMDRDIAGRVRACKLCCLSKPAQNTKLGLLASEVANRPFEKLFIDYVGPFPRSRSGNSSLLVCVDAFSKFCWLFPLRQMTTNLTVKSLKTHLFQHFGIPHQIVTDNGAQFTSKEFHRFCFGRGIEHVTTSPYYPQPSHAERFNRNLRAALIAYHAEKQTTWDECLEWLQLAFNSARHESHKGVPFELFLGYPPSSPLSNLWKVSDLLPAPGSTDILSAWNAAKRNLLRSRERVRKRYNKGRIANPFKVGDLVFCQTHPISSAVNKKAAKLCYRWSGPHRILKFLTPVTARLGHPDTGEVFRKAHISQLKAFRGGTPTPN